MKRQISIILLVVNLSFLNAFSQKVALQKADDKYERFAYIDVIKIYEEIAKKGYKDENMFRNLGDAYYFNSEFEKAAVAYDQLFEINQDQDQEYIFRYAQSLKSAGKHNHSEEMMIKFSIKSQNDSRARLFNENRNYMEVIELNSNRFKIKNAGINSEYTDFGSAIFSNQLVFTTARDTGGFAKRKHKWDNQAFTNLYAAEITQNTDTIILGKPKPFSKRINSKFHESTPVFAKDGVTMYFTRNNFNASRKGKSKAKITLLKLYKSQFIEGKWAKETELPFNSDEYSTAHPTLSPDERTLYFASDMPGSLGGSDIYKVAINDDGTFGKPENLGPAINTPGRETFPQITNEDELYFASDGHPGLGGLDVFVVKIRKDGILKNIQNLGKPVNSPKDDFAYLLDTKTRTGFFSSNRDGGKGFDDIYTFTELKKLNCEQVLEGIVRSAETNEPIVAVEVVMYDTNMEILKTTTTDEYGFYSFGTVECDSKFYIRAKKVDYITNEHPYKTPKITGNTYFPLMLKKKLVKIEPGTDLAQTNILDIPTIYFDLDKSLITKTAAFELEKVLGVLKQYPTLKIDIRSHTDSRQTHKYNQALSDKRAAATISWLIENGISGDRLTGRGYGETQLVNSCKDGVNCAEEEHQMNRRSQFIVISF